MLILYPTAGERDVDKKQRTFSASVFRGKRNQIRRGRDGEAGWVSGVKSDYEGEFTQ